MAKQQTQGLHALLIVFVLVTAVLGVVAIAFWFHSDKLATSNAELQQRIDDMDRGLRQSETENQELKEALGFAPDAELTAIDEQHQRDAALYGAGLDETQRNYRSFCQQLYTALKEKTSQVLKYQQTEQQLLADLEAARQQAQSAKENADQALAQLRQELMSTRQSLEGRRQQDETQKQALMRQVDQLARQAEQVRAELQRRVDDMQLQLKTSQAQLTVAKERLNQFEGTTFEQPDGAVTAVNQRTGTVWVNVGRDDGLRPNIAFRIYPQGSSGLEGAEAKGTIEITKVHNGHTAEARIVSDDHLRPIMRGDLIASPVWNPGARLRFALVGKMDINSDGRDDRQLVIQLIQRTGGVIDAQDSPEGEVKGQLSVHTRYLVEGDRPTEAADREQLAAYTELDRQATQLRVQRISVDRLLDEMGYSSRVRRVSDPRLWDRQPAQQTPPPEASSSTESTSQPRPARRELW